VTTKGQVTIPVTVRFALGISPGDVVVFAVEDGRGVFRRADGVLGRAGSLDGRVGADAHPLARLLVEGDDGFAAAVLEARTSRRRIDVRDAVLLDLVEDAAGDAAARSVVIDVLRDVLAERALRFEHARALTAAVDALASGQPARQAYLAARA